jgi:hypothetical protein
LSLISVGAEEMYNPGGLPLYRLDKEQAWLKMRMQIKTSPNLGMVVFTLGVLLALSFNGLAAWADFEAFLFDSALSAETSLDTLKCPIAITTTETGVVSASFTNPRDRDVWRLVRARVSHGFVTLIRVVETRLPLEPGETRTLEWEVTPEDAAWGRVILFRVYMLRSAPLPSATSACGILLAPAPGLTGNQVVALTLAASLLGLLSGAWMRGRAIPDPTLKQIYLGRTMTWLTGLLVAGMVANLLGWWLPASMLFITCLLLIAVMFVYFWARE